MRALAGADEHGRRPGDARADGPDRHSPPPKTRRGLAEGFSIPRRRRRVRPGVPPRVEPARGARPLRRPERLRDVGADAADSSGDDDDDGMGGRGGVPRGAGGGADDDGLRAARERRRADRDANRRARALERVLRRSGAKGRGMTLGACVFDPTSFSRSVEKVLDVATLVAAGRAAVGAAAEEDDAREEDVGGASAKDAPRLRTFLKKSPRPVRRRGEPRRPRREVGGTLGRAKVRRRVARAKKRRRRTRCVRVRTRCAPPPPQTATFTTTTRPAESPTRNPTTPRSCSTWTSHRGARWAAAAPTGAPSPRTPLTPSERTAPP